MFPMNMEITILQDDPVRLASAQLEELDYRKLYCAYSSQGRKSAAEPRILFEVLVYGYMCGIYSTHKLEEACRKRVDFMWLLQGEPVAELQYLCTVSHRAHQRDSGRLVLPVYLQDGINR